MASSDITEEGVRPQAVVDLARNLISIPSENPPADYGEISQFIESTLSQTDAEVVVMEGEPGKRNVAALLRGSDPKGPTLLFDGHMDVVPAGERSQWDVDPYGAEIRNGQIWGRGAMDMKGSLASQIHAFMTVANSGDQLRGNLVFAATCDDETAGKMGMGHVYPQGFEVAGWPSPTFHVLGEANQLNITTSFKGRIWVEVEAQGKRAHGGAPDRGINAIDGVIMVSDKLRALMNSHHELVGNDTFNFGTIKGGDQVNVVPDHCSARFDMRFGPQRNAEEILSGIEGVIESANGAAFSTKILERRDPLELDPGETPAIELLANCIAEVTGRSAEIQGTLSAGDLIYTGSRGIPGVWVGPGDPAFFHVINERVDIDELVKASQIYVRFIRKYLGVGA